MDIFIAWFDHTYKVRVDDVTVVLNATFKGLAVRRIGLYGLDAGTVWFDEVGASPQVDCTRHATAIVCRALA